MLQVYKLFHAMTAIVVRRRVRAGTKVLALLPGSPVLQSFVPNLERERLWRSKKGMLLTRFDQDSQIIRPHN